MTLKYNTSFNLENMKECLDLGCRILQDAGCKFWLSDGALLGIAKTGEVLKHDHDFDMGILGDSQLPDLLDKFPSSFQKLEWSREILFGKLQGFAFTYKSWIFDLRFWYDAGDYLINAQRYPGTSGWNIGTFYESKKLFANLGELDWHGIKVPIPDPLEDYLSERYGNWRGMKLTGENRWWLYSTSFKNNNLVWEKIK